MFKHLFNTNQVHQWITYGWFGSCIATIFVAMMIIWATIIHYTYRKKWRTLDVLLAAVLIQELPNAIIVAVISSIKSSLIHFSATPSMAKWNVQATNMTISDILLWSSTSTRLFQFAIITSLIADRALILKWPYQYRFTVRHSQIRFYMIALALVSSLFGAFAVISHQSHLNGDDTDNNNNNNNNVTTVQSSKFLLEQQQSWTLFELTDASNNDNNTNITSITTTTTTAETSLMPSSNETSYRQSFVQFSYDPTIYQAHYSYFFITIYGVLTLICLSSFLYVESNRPRTSSKSSSNAKNHHHHHHHHHQQQQQRYLQSIATLFTTATTSSTATSSSTSSSLSASSPSPSRFSSLANLTNGGSGGGVVGGSSATATSQPPLHLQSSNNNNGNQSSKTTTSIQLPSYYYPNVKHHHETTTQKQLSNCQPRKPSDTLNSQYQISIVDQDNSSGSGVGGGQLAASSTYTSMTTTDNSIHRLIDATNNDSSASRSNSLNLNNDKMEQRERDLLRAVTPNDNRVNGDNGSRTGEHCLSQLEMAQPPHTNVDSFSSKTHHHHHNLNQLYSSSQLKLNAIDLSNDSSSSAFSTTVLPSHRHHHHSAFDLRWSSVVGPVSFCFAFNHGPYLVFTLLAIFIPGIWTPFHDLILVGLSLFQALFLPLIIFISNETFRNAVKRSCLCCYHRNRHSHHHHHHHHRHNKHHYSLHKISAITKSHQKSSLAYSTNDGNVILATPPPSYLHAAGISSKSSNKLSPLTSNNYHSDLDLMKKFPKIDQSSSKLSKISFLKHSKEYHQKPLHAATSMLDLSLSSRNAYQHGGNYQHQYPHHQTSQQHYHASRSRYSLALAQQFSANNNNSLTPKSSFCRRPPSVASCHYLFSNQSAQSKGGRYSQYLLGAMPPNKSESTLSVPLSMAAVSNHFVPSSLIQNQLKEMKKDNNNKTNIAGKCSPISINLNHRFDSPIPVVNNMPISSEMNDGNFNSPVKEDSPNKSGSKLIELISGLATRSSFRKRSVRKCDSDASTFYNRHNLKRSQIAQNQLTNILYNNFYNKKLVSSAFGSEIILMPENENVSSPLFKRAVDPNNAASFDAYENSAPHPSPVVNQPSGQFPRPHVYLPSISNCLETNSRSNSCQQLSILNGETAMDHHYHNHLLLKQNNSPMAEKPSNKIKSKRNDFNSKQNQILMPQEEEEPIYASLAEELADEIKASGSFSARSTLPDDCQLISYGETTAKMSNTSNNENRSNVSNVGALINHNKNMSENNGGPTKRGDNCQNYGDNNVNNGISSSNNSSSSSSDTNISNSSSTLGESSEDIYEEVGHLTLDISTNHHRNVQDIENNFNKKRSASQDTLIEHHKQNDPFDSERKQINDDFSDDDDDDDGDDDDDDDGDDELEEDQISILSEASSSTFSSFTTCANQDFEFIVSQQMSNVAKTNADDDGTVMTESKNLKKINVVDNEKEKNSLEPSTLSMAAMYYNRLILNKDSNHSKSGHRQRSKLNRRQSFSTAHELRQRILCNQTNLNKENREMGLIEEEIEDSNNSSIQGSINEYPIFTANMFGDMFPLKLDRRISSSEDNLLSMISTIANCGDDQESESNSNSPSKTPKITDEETIASSDDNTKKDNSNGTFVMKKDSSPKTNNKPPISAIPRATFLSPKLVPSQNNSRPINNEPSKITIKELKSKKQASTKKVMNNIIGAPVKAKLTLNGSSNRVYELGSLWERQSANKREPVIAEKYIPNNSLLKSPGITMNGSCNKSPLQTKSNQSGICPPLQISKPNNTTTTTVTTTTSIISSPSRVPTFIAVSPIRTPKHTTNILAANTNQNFTSKLPTPSEYVVSSTTKQPKQDARQNAILAKNALLMSGMRGTNNNHLNKPPK